MTGRLHVQRLSLARLAPDLKSTEPLIESPNLAPRQPVSAFRLEQGRLTHTPLFWGLTPPWLKVLDHAPHHPHRRLHFLPLQPRQSVHRSSFRSP